jgi:membrane-bound lytic murein transglycosylase MltF
LSAIISDDWLVNIWKPVLPAITVNSNAVVHGGGSIGWAIRRNSPRLQAEIDDLFRRFEATLKLFEKYGARYNFDPLMLVAQGFQESRLDQDARSHVGAVGIMQIMPAVGKELNVGDIHVAEANIHAGAKYMDVLMTRYFRDAKFSEADRSLFAFACYNAGPGNIRRMREEARRRGLDPDQWFNNVEAVTAEKIGVETTAYVRNIFKYYVAYKLTAEIRQAQEKARSLAVPTGR